jgi:hypothetical protein
MILNYSLKLKLLNLLKENKRIYLAYLLAFLVIINAHNQQSETYSFYGIADTREVNINSPFGVKIKNINVIAGEKIFKDKLLLELENPDLEFKIYELKKALDETISEVRFNQRMNGGIKEINFHEITNESNPLLIKIKNLSEQLAVLEKQKNELNVFAEFDAIIGSINVKVGEQIPAFTPLLTVHNSSPSVIKGYIHENVFNQVQESQILIASSIADPRKKIEAKVISLGRRMVEFPSRLLKNDLIPIWGREVILKIPVDNPFLVGEKIYLEPQPKFSSSFLLTASENTKITNDYNEFFRLTSNVELHHTPLEPSGLLYFQDLNKILMISDDTGKKKKPYLQYLNDKGVVEKEILISGLDTINDMESLAIDEDGFIYVASSMSTNRKDEVSDDRKYLLKIKRDKFDLKLVKKINLYNILKSALLENPDASWVKYVSNKKRRNLIIDVEGIIVKENTLYLGLRQNNFDEKLVILKVSNLNSLFDNQRETSMLIQVHAEFSPPKDDDFKNEGISDLVIIKDRLYVLTVNNSGKAGGRIFETSLNNINRDIKQVRKFYHLKPEGLTYNSLKDEYVISFDQGDEGSSVLVTNTIYEK